MGKRPTVKVKRQQAERRRNPGPQQFCDRCLAVIPEFDTCPNCDLLMSTFDKFCRNCLHVHNNKQICAPWKASS